MFLACGQGRRLGTKRLSVLIRAPYAGWNISMKKMKSELNGPNSQIQKVNKKYSVTQFFPLQTNNLYNISNVINNNNNNA